MSYQPPMPGPGTPGWQPPGMAPGPQQLPPGAGVCTACGYVGPMNYGAALGVPGTHRWCPRCNSNLGPAPIPHTSNSAGCGILLLALILAPVVFAVVGAIISR